MDCSDLKVYHLDGLETRDYLDTYMPDKPDKVFEKDLLQFPIEYLRELFKDGHIKGDVLIELSISSMVHTLYAACDFFEYIIALKANFSCVMELKRWLDTRTGAFDWNYATKLHVGNSDQVQEKEKKLKSSVNHVMRCDVEQENIMDPLILPQADCIITSWLLEAISKTEEDYIKHLRKFATLLKPGGTFICIGNLNTKYFKVGDEKYHALSYDDSFAKKALVGTGFVIDSCKVKERTAVSDLTDYNSSIIIVAHKEM